MMGAIDHASHLVRIIKNWGPQMQQATLFAKGIFLGEFALGMAKIKELLEIQRLQIELLRRVLDPHLPGASLHGALESIRDLLAISVDIAQHVARAVTTRVITADQPCVMVLGQAFAQQVPQLQTHCRWVEGDARGVGLL